MDAAVDALIQHGGPAAAVLVICGTIIIRLHNQLTEVQEKRIADAQQVSTKMLEIAKENNAQRERFVEVLALNTQALGESREQLDELRDRLHRRSP